mgnify:CR=1 FL=1
MVFIARDSTNGALADALQGATAVLDSRFELVDGARFRVPAPGQLGRDGVFASIDRADLVVASVELP